MMHLLVLAALILFGAVGPVTAHGPTACSDRYISAAAIRTQSDIQAFVECAKEFVEEQGTEEATHAFHEDEFWNHGSIYVFVDGIAESGTEAMTFVYPPDPSREGMPWGEAIDDFGTDLFYEVYRMMQSADAGWTYYSITNPETGVTSPKASYVIEIDWDGSRAVIGAGIYSPDWPGTCGAGEVTASVLKDSPSPETLEQFVRCAALVVESEGYFAKHELETDPRWRHGNIYAYVLDMMGNQLMTGSRLRVNGEPLYEFGRRDAGYDQFGGRDMIDVGHTFGEAHIYYQAFNHETGRFGGKAAFLKRVVSQGVPVLVGAGYYLDEAPMVAATPCEQNTVAANSIRSQEDVQAFVRCAAEYAKEHGEEEARRAFNEDHRWKEGPTYVFVDEVTRSGATSMTHVFPPDPSREGSLWGVSLDSFGSDYYAELHRILSLVDEGWIHYAFRNPATGLNEPKSSYVIEMDWNGDRAAIGAGFYAADFPGACDPAEVNAMELEFVPTDDHLREFVTCAAHMVANTGLFAAPILETSPRWNHGSAYVFGVDVMTGLVLFSSSPASWEISGRIPELFDGRDMIAAGALFGEVFWYYDFTDRASGQLRNKVGFVKLVQTSGRQILVGSGYNRFGTRGH